MNKKLLIAAVSILTAAGAYLGNTLSSQDPAREPRIHQHLNDPKINEENSSIQIQDFSSHLPLILINTIGEEINDQTTVDCKIKIINQEGTLNHPQDSPQVETWAAIKWRGNSSLRFDKKQYRITFLEERGGEKERDCAVMGMREESDWVLNAPYLDKTLMRNYMMYNISGEIMDWAPNVRFCEMFLNEKYMGLYLMVETVKVSPNRLNLKELEKGQSQTSYLISRERFGDHSTAINNFGTYTGKTVNEVGIQYPTQSKINNKLITYIKNDISDIEKALYSLDYDEWDYGYARCLDVNSFIDYYIINEFSSNMDAGALSTFAYKDLRGKLTMGPVWDFNNCFDNYKHMPVTPDFLYLDSAPWYVMLMRDEIFVDDVIKRYHQLRKTYLSDEYILQYIDDTREYLGNAIDRNFQIWGYTFQENMLHPESRDIHSYQEAIEQLKEAVRKRGEFLDNNINILKQFCAESNVKEFN